MEAHFMLRLFLTIAAAGIFLNQPVRAKTPMPISSEVYNYKSGDKEFEGYLAQPKKIKGKLPVVLVVHEWTGLGEYAQGRAKKLAEMGYIALAADIYGKGVRPSSPQDAGKESSIYKNNRELMRERIKLAYNEAKKLKNADASKIVVIGYCFGGTTALELGRSGVDLAGIVSFHGGLENPSPKDAKNIKAKSLILHGAIDPYVPAKEVASFQKEMDEAKVDYQLIQYSGAVHSFTNPAAGNDIKAGFAYDAQADKRSWIAFNEFLKEVAPVK
jgi:dienelactone hydrolase